MNPTKPNRAALYLLLVAAWFAVGPGPRAAAEPVFKPYAGFAGFFRPGDWTPISVVIQNKAESVANPQTLVGTLRVICKPVQGQGDDTVFSRRVEVTQHQITRVMLYAKISSSRNCVIEFVNQRGRRLWSRSLEQDLTALTQGQILLINASEVGGPFSAISGMRLDSVRQAHMNPMFLPDRAIGYESVNLIALPKDPANAMTDDGQKQAMLRWIRQGGRLLAVGGIDYQSYADSFLKEALPVEITGSEEALFPTPDGEGFRTLVSTFELKPGACALWPHGGRSLAARWQYGAGEVTFSSLDLNANMARNTLTTRAFWDSVVHAPPAGRDHKISDALVFGADDMGFGKAARLPSLALVLLILACYTVLVGPVNFYYLNKRRRLELAWLTTPLIVLSFCAMTYTIGAISKGGLLIVRELDFLETRAGLTEAKMDKTLTVFSPRKQTYDLSLNLPQSSISSVWKWRYSFNFPGLDLMIGPGRQIAISGAGWPAVIDQAGGSMRMNERLMGQWTHQYFSAGATVDLGGGMQGEATYQGRSMRIRIENSSDLILNKSILLVGGRAAAVGDFPPGSKRTFWIPDVWGESTGSPRLSLPNFAQNDAETILLGSVNAALDMDLASLAQQDVIAVAKADDDEYVKAFHEAKLWKRYNEPPDSMIPPSPQPLLPRLVGWIENPPDTLEINHDPDRYAHSAMIVVEIPLTLSPGDFRVPPELAVTYLSEWSKSERGGEFFINDYGLYEFDNAEAVFTCSPGFRDRPIEITSLTFSDPRMQNIKGKHVEILVFDFLASKWETLLDITSPEQQIGSIPLPARYANPFDGSVFTRVKVESVGGKFAQSNLMMPPIKIGFEGRGK